MIYVIKVVAFDLCDVIVKYNNKQYLEYLAKKATFNEKFEEYFDSLDAKVDVGALRTSVFEDTISRKLSVPKSYISYRNAFEKLGSLDKDVLGIVNHLAKRYKIVLLSNLGYSQYQVAIRKFIPKNLFYRRFVSCYTKLKKPDNTAYRYMIGQLNVMPDEIVFIDDKKNNIIAAREAGIKGIVFKNPKQLRKALMELAVHI